MIKWSLISPVNSEGTLNKCLLQSPDIAAVSEVFFQKNYPTAASAYNNAIDRTTADLMIFVHQDVYFPPGWLKALENSLAALSLADPNWGVLGVWGRQTNGSPAGHLYWNPVGVGGRPFEGFIEVETLDEVVLIMRKSAGLRFDEAVPGFHMYGPDICLEARRRGMRCYAIPAFCVHNNNEYGMLPLDFWRGYLTLRKKWKTRLPVQTTCTKITYWCWPMVRWNLSRAFNLITRRDKPPVRRTADPVSLYRTLAESNQVLQKCESVSQTAKS